VPSFCALVVLVAVLATGTAAQKEPEGSAWSEYDKKTDLNGTWTSTTGDKMRIYEVRQQGDSVMFTAEDENFTGQLSGASLDLSDTLNEKTVNSKLPDWVRKLLIGQPVYIRGTLNPDGHTIDAKLIGKKERWEVTGNEKKITGVEDTTTSLPLVREPIRYYIADMKLDYAGWKEYVDKVRERLNTANQHLIVADAEFDSAKKALDNEQITLGGLKQHLEKINQAQQQAGQKASKCTPDEAQKTSAYRDAQKALRDATNKAETARQLYEANKLEPGKPVTVSAKTTSDYFQKKYEEAQAEVARQEAHLKQVMDDMGFTREVEAARAQFEAFKPKVAAAQKAYDQQAAKVAAAQDSATKAQATFAAASKEFSEALAAQKLVQGTPIPRFSDVRVASGPSVKYHAEFWSPDEALRKLDPQIWEAADRLERMNGRRYEAKAEFLARHAEAQEAGEAWANAIMTSAYLQAGVETCSYGIDMVKAAKGGPVGVIAELAKKVTEAAMFGSIEFYEPDIELKKDWEDPAETLLPDDILRTTGKGIVKNPVNGNIIEAAAFTFEKNHNIRVIEELTAARANNETLREAEKQLQESLERYEEAKGALLWKLEPKDPFLDPKKYDKWKNWKKNGGDLAKDIAKDLAADELKKIIGEYFEGEAAREYLIKEGTAAAAAKIFLMASTRYWKSYDTYQTLVALRSEVLKLYDPKKGANIDPPEWFRRGQDLSVELKPLVSTGAEAGGGGPSPNLKVTIGGRPLRAGAGTYRFLIDSAEKLKHDGNGGVQLEIQLVP